MNRLYRIGFTGALLWGVSVAVVAMWHGELALSLAATANAGLFGLGLWLLAEENNDE